MTTMTTQSTVTLGQKPYVSPYTSVGAEWCKNCYLEKSTNDTTRVPFYKVGCPGAVVLRKSTENSLIPTSAAGRGMCTFANRTFFVAGSYFCELFSGGTSNIIGSLKSTSGQVRFDSDGTILFIVDGYYGYTFNITTGAFHVVTDSYYPGISDGTANAPRFVQALNSYFLVEEENTQRYYWSTPAYKAQAFDTNQPSVKNQWYSLYYANAKIRPGNIVALSKLGQYLLVWTNSCCEVHECNTSEKQTWQRVGSTFMNIGTSAPASIATYQNITVWLASDPKGTVGIFKAGLDFNPQKISERGIEEVIQTFDDITDCQADAFAMDGHMFISFYFPTADRTFVYDLVTEAWHERTYLEPSTGIDHAWRMINSTYNWSMNIFQDRMSSAIYYLDSNVFDNDTPDGTAKNYVNVDFTTPLMTKDGKNVRYCGAQVVCQQGVGLNTNNADGTGENPICRLSWSDDSGSSWSNEIQIPMGKLGEYTQRTRRCFLGMSRSRQFRIRCTAPVRRVFSALILDTVDMAR